MHVLSFLRSLVGGPRRRPIGALAILTVIVGVVTMHSMSGSPTSHTHQVPHGAAVVDGASVVEVSVGPASRAAAERVTTSGPTAVADTSAQGPEIQALGEPGTGACHDGCGGHDLTTAMCLMVLVAMLALVVPARRLLWRAPLEVSTPLLPAPAGVRAVAAPSLHELCISRT
ncbi:DUF6153 family protein [Myceligenerans pegani]|uniref:Uncharacterized protein n=1 Tax=Myceligenerans pegani TaxID=2776917 RepID=A0ABR9MY14_9MICO|nr:DUF6153 family protein [Myceligenerans sp. TRM 65318]MBE1876273.1 hypothetical protein [Myceligenerans sp. TRM 65318]MBE3018544.1 hypothetical protein [Myceligenerans sp. TRM 65318]